ncbi:MAG TPA: hypothetical protein VL092_06590 [Chitinophagaceae bacterium]|nr:hypothetical protein [Chitinophagaceae bacterium]
MRNILLTLMVCLLATTSEAQNIYNSSGRKTAKKTSAKKGFDRDKLVLGGDFRLGIGQQISVGIAPIVGYKLVDNFYAGVRLGYSYDRFKIDYSYLPASATTNVFSFNSYSGGVWARYLFWQTIYVHTEFEYNIFDTYYPNDITGLYEKKSIKSPSVLLGVGLRQPISDRASFNATILYDVLNDPYSYYNVTGKGGFDFRIGLLVGF